MLGVFWSPDNSHPSVHSVYSALCWLRVQPCLGTCVEFVIILNPGCKRPEAQFKDLFSVFSVFPRFKPALNGNRFLSLQRRVLNSLNVASGCRDYGNLSKPYPQVDILQPSHLLVNDQWSFDWPIRLYLIGWCLSFSFIKVN